MMLAGDLLTTFKLILFIVTVFLLLGFFDSPREYETYTGLNGVEIHND